MSARRESEEFGSDYGSNNGRDSPNSSDDRSPVRRQTSVRLSRRSGAGGSQSRVSLNRSGGSTSVTASNSRSSARTRRPTPIARRRRVAEDDGEDLDDEATGRGNSSSSARRQQVGISATFDRRRGGAGASVATYQRYSSNDPSELTWYDRLMPECILNITAPLTGYESRLDPDVDDDEYEILERQRLKRNRRIRRRLLTLAFLATAGALFMYTRGKLMRKAGVKAAVSSIRHRLEDGLAKSIHDTMGQ